MLANDESLFKSTVPLHAMERDKRVGDSFCSHCSFAQKIRIFAPVKKLITLFFVAIHLLAFCECHQFLKISFLVKHFQKHQQEDSTMSFGKFVRIHYLCSAVITDDLQQDEKLPFRSVDCNITTITYFNSDHSPIQIAPPPQPSTKFYAYDETNKAQIAAFDIFQPPRHS